MARNSNRYVSGRKHSVSVQAGLMAFVLAALMSFGGGVWAGKTVLKLKKPHAEPLVQRPENYGIQETAAWENEDASGDDVSVVQAGSSEIDELLARLKAPVDLSDMGLGAEAEKWSREARNAVFYAKKIGVWETTVKVCDAIRFSSAEALTLAYFESGLGRDTYNPVSGAESIFQILDDPFLEMFARYAQDVLPIVREIDPQIHQKMKPLVGLVKMIPRSEGMSSDFGYNVEAYKKLSGKKKAGVEQLKKDIKKEILALRQIKGKDPSLRGVVATCLALWDLKLKTSESGLHCLPRLIHNYGQRGGTAIARAARKTPNKTMYAVMMEVYEPAIKNQFARKKHVLKLLRSNGIKNKDGKPDTDLSVASFVKKTEKSWKAMVACFAQWQEKMGIAAGLSAHLEASGAPFQVVLDSEREPYFTIQLGRRQAQANPASATKFTNG